MIRRGMLSFFLFACLVTLPAVSHAAPAEFRVLFDDDNSIATGCTVAGMSGVDQILITRIDLGTTTATVTGTSRQVCQGDGTLGAAIPVASTGWPAAYNVETGDLMIETRVAFSVFDNPAPGQLQKMRIGVDARQGSLVHIALTADNEPVYFPVPAKGKRRAVAAPGAVRMITLDGLDTDWTGLKNKFHNIATGGMPGWRMNEVLAFANTHDDFVYFAFRANVSDNAPFAADDEYSREQGEGLTVPGANGLPTVLANDIDPNGVPLKAKLVSPPQDGTVVLDETGGFVYTPDNPNAITQDSFEYRAFHGDLDSNVATVTIVTEPPGNSPNKAPSFTKGFDVAILEDALTQFINNWATNISAGAGEIGQAVSFVITGNTNPALFEHPPQVSPSGQLSFTPAANAFGSATISIKIVDDGGTANGGVNESAVQTFIISIDPVNDEPAFTPGGDVTVNEDSGSYTATWATGISAGPNESESVSFLVSNDNNGLFASQPAIAGNGTLSFTPAANAHGVANVTVVIKDNGSNAAPNDNTGATANFTITVNSLNDPPSFTVGPNQTVNEDAGPQTVSPWATDISEGPADESGQQVTFNISNPNPGLFSNGPAISDTGVLTYTPAADVSGFANITITLSDNGSPVATSAPQSFMITVNAVNDEPSFTGGGDVLASSDAGAYSQPNWATNIVTGPAAESGQTVMFEITNNTNGGLFTNGPAIDPSGTLTFTPVAGASGAATITVQMRDTGGVANGGDDLSAPVTFTITLDSAPAVTATSPLNGATGVATNSNVTITFDENVNVNSAYFQISCATSGMRSDVNSNLSGGPLTFTIDPVADFAPGETCTVTIFASMVTDQDSADGPDTMAANYSFSFTTDAQPSVTATTPANGQVGVTTTSNVSITFSEPVNVTGTWFQISCATSGMHDPSNSVVSGGPTTFSIDPANFVQGELCSATVYAAQVSDVDTNDPLDNLAANYNFNFTIDAEPYVVSTSPANGDFTQQPNTNVTIVFSEAVNVTGNWFSLACGTSGTRTPANTVVTTSDNITFTLNPNADFAVGETCTSVIVASLVSDQDGNDPPDNPPADYNFTFGFDAPPSVTTTTPANSATNLGTSTDITITFSEDVTLTAGWLSITCGASTITEANGVVTGGPSVYTFNPTANLPEGATCNVTVLATAVADNDANDPPDNMTANHTFSFTTDAPPSVASTTPTNGAADQASNSNVVITFDEPVTIGAGTWFTIVCGTSGTHDPSNSVTTGSGTAVITINPADFTPGETCNATVFAAEVADADANDPPNLLAANYLFSFSIDAAPSVTSATPLSGATNVATNTDLTITFSEPVTITNASVTISCGTSGAHTVTVSGGPTVWTVNPDVDFATGEICAVSVLAAQVSDNDTNDPPNNMLADYNFSFTTDAPPSVVATTPVNGATVAPAADITIQFSETVAVTGTWFDITCTISGAHTAVESGGPTTFTLNPTTDFTGGESCTVTVFAAQVDDLDAGDPPSNLTSNYSFTFNVDAAPAVLTTTPANGATGVVTNANVTVNFSESVNTTATAFSIACTTSGAHAFATGASPASSFTLNPTVDFTPGETCTVTVAAAEVTDADAFDPPNNMAGDYQFSFTIDAAPAVSATTPTAAATDVSGGADVTVTFTEPVTATAASFTISCATSGAHTFALSGGPTTWTLNPDTNFSSGETCTVTVLAAGVTDVDANDPPDNMLANHVFTFTIDVAPSVTTTTPADNAISIATNASVTIDFSESVNLTASPVTISCANSGAHTYTVSAGPATSFTIDPDTDFAIGELCTVTVLASQVSDVDANDPPDNMTANYVFDFTTDLDPTVVSTTPTNGGITGPDSDITVTFSEAVAMTDPWFTVSCTTSGTHTAVVTGGPTVWTINPDTGFTAGETCNVSILAAQVADLDAGDPPNNMLGNYNFSFTVDGAPSVVSTSPTNGDSDKAANINIVITYDEAVTAGGTAYALTCTASNTSQAFVLSGNGTAVHTLDPTADLPHGQPCTVSIVAAQIADVDANDPPDNMASNYSFSFSTDANPQIQSKTPNDGATGVTSNANISITFTESVTLTAVGISCTVSGAHTNVLSAGPAVTYTVNPDTDFTPGETCTVTVLGANVTDTDTNDPPDTMGPNVSWQFTIDQQPTVTNSNPAPATGNLPTNTNIVITFSEAITAPDSAFKVECPVGAAQTFVRTGDGTITTTLDPTADLPAGVTCTVTVLAAQVADVDANDPPDNMPADHVFTFTTDAAPSVTATVPTSNATDVAKNANIVITFSENVDVTASSFSIKCPAAGSAIPFAFVGASTNTSTVTLNPDSDLVSGELCQVTVIANQVQDSDTNDPPNNMAADHVFTFGVEPDAIDDAHPHTHVGNIPSNSATFFKVTTNDVSANSFTITAYDSTTVNGGTIVMQTTGANMGEFTYNPPPGFEGADTFTYTISNPLYGTDTATVTINVSGMVWFIDANDTVGPFDGRITSPFSSLQQFNAVNGNADVGNARNPQANDNIFLYESGNAYLDPVTLENGQKLIGQDSTTAAFGAGSITGLAPAPSQVAAPGVNSANGIFVSLAAGAAGPSITLAQNNQVRGLRFGSNAVAAVSGSGFGTLFVRDVLVSNGTGGAFHLTNGTVDVVLSSLSTTGGTHALNFNNVGGSFTGGPGTISNPTTAGIATSGGTALAINFSGTISTTGRPALLSTNLANGSSVTLNTVNVSGSGAGLDAVTIDGTNGEVDVTITSATLNTGSMDDGVVISDLGANSSVTISGGSITSSGSGRRVIEFGGTTNCACNFSAVTLNANTSDGLSLGSGQLGTYTFQDIDVNSPATGVGVQVVGDGNVGTTDSTVTFRSIDINTCSQSGIAVNNHNGSFTVTGTGAANSGGTITNCTQRGARFGTGAGTAATGARNISLTDMSFTGNGTTNIGANDVCGDAANAENFDCAANIDLQDVTNVTLTRIVASNSAQIGINGRNVTDLTLTSITANLNGTENLEDGIQLVNLVTTSPKTWQDLNLTNNSGRQLEVQNNSGSHNITISKTAGGTLQFANTNFPLAVGTTPSSTTSSNGVLWSGSGTAGMTVSIQGATFARNFGAAFLSTIKENASITYTVNGGSMIDNGLMLEGGASNGSGTYNYTLTNLATAYSDPAHTNSSPIGILKGLGSSGAFIGNISNNQIHNGTNAGAAGPCDGCTTMLITNGGASGSHSLTISGNTIRHSRNGIVNVTSGINSSPDSTQMNLTLTNNTFSDPDDTDNDLAVTIVNGTDPTDTSKTCATITGNSITDPAGGGSWNTSALIRLRHVQNNQQFKLASPSGGYTGSGTDTTAVAAFLNANNTLSTPVTAAGVSLGSGSFVGGTSCP